MVIRCDGCKHFHLIADNLKWFDDKTSNIESIMEEKGEKVLRVSADEALEEILREKIKRNSQEIMEGKEK